MATHRLGQMTGKLIVNIFVVIFTIGQAWSGELGAAPAFAEASAWQAGQALRWRNIGPYRGGRTRAICGVPSQPNLFYMAPVNGGVFKSIDYGRAWQPIFDDQPTASVGAIAVAPSNPNIVYVGSGEGLHRPDLSVGDGKQQCAAEVKETKIIREKERAAKYGRCDNDADPECDESYFPVRAICWHRIHTVPFSRFDAATIPSGFK